MKYFFNLRCRPQYTGDRCETFTPYPTHFPTGFTQFPTGFRTTTSVPRCNFTIGLLNDGIYTSRFRVEYSVDGIRQPMITSDSLPFVGQRTKVIIPYYARDVKITLERLGFVYAPFHQEVLPQSTIATSCTKCFKVWGAVTDPKWDYIEC